MKNIPHNHPQIPQIPQNNNLSHQSEDLVLQQFYQQRKKRQQISGKRHSLLQKKSSYFSNSNSRSSVMQSVNTQKSENNENNGEICQVKLGKMSRGSSEFYKNITNNNGDKKNLLLASGVSNVAQTEIKNRMIKANQAEILSKYININNGYKYENGNKQNKTMPTTPKYHQNSPKQSSFFMKKSNEMLLDSNHMVNSKINERKKSLIQMQQNYKNLTGQQFSFVPLKTPSSASHNNKKQSNLSYLSLPLSQSAKINFNNSNTNSINANANIKQKLQNYIQKTRNISSIESSGLRSTLLQSNLSIKDQHNNKYDNNYNNNNNNDDDVVYSSNNIKIINKTRSQSQKQKYSGEKIKEFQKDKKISIQQIIQNHSFCHKYQNQQENELEFEKYQRQTSKYEQKQDEPLLVLAHQNHKNKQKDNNHQQSSQQLQNQSDFSKYEDHNSLKYNYNEVSSPNFKMCEYYQEQQASKFQNSLTLQLNQRQFYNKRGAKIDEKYRQSNKKSENMSNQRHNSLKNSSLSQKNKPNLSQFQLNTKISNKNNTQISLQQQLQKTKQKLQQLQKLSKKQNKFIESVQNMRKVLNKQQKNCSLKELWRWVKMLPNYQYQNNNN